MKKAVLKRSEHKKVVLFFVSFGLSLLLSVGCGALSNVAFDEQFGLNMKQVAKASKGGYTALRLTYDDPETVFAGNGGLSICNFIRDFNFSMTGDAQNSGVFAANIAGRSRATIKELEAMGNVVFLPSYSNSIIDLGSGNYRMENFRMYTVFKESNTDYSGFSNFCYITQKQADFLLANRNEYSTYVDLINAPITVQFKGVEYKWKISNIVKDFGPYYTRLNEAFDNFVVMYTRTPLLNECEVCCFFGGNTFFNQYLFKKMRSLSEVGESTYSFALNSGNPAKQRAILSYCEGRGVPSAPWRVVLFSVCLIFDVALTGIWFFAYLKFKLFVHWQCDLFASGIFLLVYFVFDIGHFMAWNAMLFNLFSGLCFFVAGLLLFCPMAIYWLRRLGKFEKN